jgi:hypothetical protein
VNDTGSASATTANAHDNNPAVQHSGSFKPFPPNRLPVGSLL